MADLRLSVQGAKFIGHHEGTVRSWYLDPVGIPTIGRGFTWRSDSFREWWAKNRPGQNFVKGVTMTDAEIDDAFRFMFDREYGRAVNKFLAGRNVPQHVFDAASSAVFNFGTGGLHWKWAQAMKAGDYRKAAELLRTTATTAQGRPLRGLVLRRKEEAELLEHGDYLIGDRAPAPIYKDPLADGMLVKGERGQPVADLQKALADLGLYKGKVDGIFGFGTEAAVLAFQRSRGLAADGHVGPQTFKELKGDGHPVTLPPLPPEAPVKRNPVTAILALTLAGGAAIYTFLKAQGWAP